MTLKLYEIQISVPYIKFYRNTAMLIHLCAVSGCSHATTIELNTWNRNSVAHGAQNILWPLRSCSTFQPTDEKTVPEGASFPRSGPSPGASQPPWKALCYFLLLLRWLTLGPERHFWNKHLGSNVVSKKSKGSGRGGKERGCPTGRRGCRTTSWFQKLEKQVPF